MDRLPDDLRQYLRRARLGERQRSRMRELASAVQERTLTAAEYARAYVKRAITIQRMLSD